MHRTASPTAAAAALSAAEFEPMSTRDLLTAYHFFGFLWMNAFITGVGIMSVAGAVCHWPVSTFLKEWGHPFSELLLMLGLHF